MPSGTQSEIRQKSNLFSVRTDTEIARLERLLARQTGSEIEVSGLGLDMRSPRQIGFEYFRRCNDKRFESGGYLLSPGDDDYDDLRFEAGRDVDAALAEAAGTYRTTDLRVLKLLSDEGIPLPKELEGLIENGGWPEGLEKHRPFQVLCRLVEHADLEIARRRYRSWQAGSLQPIENQDFAQSHLPLPEPERAAQSAKTIADLTSAYFASKANLTKSSVDQFRVPFRALTEHFGEAFPLTSIDRESARTLVTFLPTIPSHATQHYKGLRLSVAAERWAAVNGQPANRWEEAEKSLRVIASAFQLAFHEGWIAANPWLGLHPLAPLKRNTKLLRRNTTHSRWRH